MGKSYCKKDRKFEKDTVNLAAKLFLAEMKLESEKHAKILWTMLGLLEQSGAEKLKIGASSIIMREERPLWDMRIRSYVDTQAAKKMLEDNVEGETKMLRHIKEEMKKTDYEVLKLLVKHIADDEKKHIKIIELYLRKPSKWDLSS